MAGAKTLDDIYELFDYEDYLHKEDFYVELYEEELSDFTTDLEKNKNPKKTFFLAGQSGNGKSSVLHQLKNTKPQIAKKYSVKFLDGKDLFWYDDIDITDILLMIGFEIIKEEPELVKAYAEKLQKIELIKSGELELSESSQEKENTNLKAGASITIGAKFLSFLKSNISFDTDYSLNSEFREDARRFFKIRRRELLDTINDIIRQYVSKVSNGKDILLIIDDLEKKDNIDELFLKDIPILNEIECRKIVSMPIHLQRNGNFDKHDVREFGVRIKNFKQKEYIRESIDNLKKIVYSRIENKDLIDDESVEKAAQMSGGNLRQLIKIINYASAKAMSNDSEEIGEYEINKAIDRISLDLSTRVMSHAKFLDHIHKEQIINQEDASHKESIASVTKGGLVYAYFNGITWYDINPITEKSINFYLGKN